MIRSSGKGCRLSFPGRDMRIVGEAADGDEALRKARELAPDVVLMDISMPGMNGLAVTEVLRKEAPEIKVLILSVHNNKDVHLPSHPGGRARICLQGSAPGGVGAGH